MTDKAHHEGFINKAIELARLGASEGHGGPFGALVVKHGTIIGEGFNCVTSSNDPTAHAEIVAIRQACKLLGSYQLTDCVIYCSCEPCPMCLGAIYWARPEKVFFASTRQDAANAGFDDAFIYEEIKSNASHRRIPMIFTPQGAMIDIFEKWKANPDKITY